MGAFNSRWGSPFVLKYLRASSECGRVQRAFLPQPSCIMHHMGHADSWVHFIHLHYHSDVRRPTFFGWFIWKISRSTGSFDGCPIKQARERWEPGDNHRGTMGHWPTSPGAPCWNMTVPWITRAPKQRPGNQPNKQTKQELVWKWRLGEISKVSRQNVIQGLLCYKVHAKR